MYCITHQWIVFGKYVESLLPCFWLSACTTNTWPCLLAWHHCTAVHQACPYMFITGSILNEDVFFLPRYVLYICTGFSTAVFVLHNEFHPWLLNIRRELNHAMGLEPMESPTSSQFEYCNCNYKLLGTNHGCICVLAWFVRIWSRKEGGEGGREGTEHRLIRKAQSPFLRGWTFCCPFWSLGMALATTWHFPGAGLASLHRCMS